MATLYCTEAEIQATYGDVFWDNIADEDDNGTADFVTPAIEWASSTIDGILGKKYDLPLAEVPARLRETAVDLAVYRRATTADRKTDIIQSLHDDAMKYLHAVGSGKISLGLDNPPTSLRGGVTIVTNEREITKAKWDDL